MPPGNFQFWVEYGSTYTYLSVMRVEALARAEGVAPEAIEWKPFFLFPIFLEVGWKEAPFTQMPAKGAYMWRDLERRAARHGLPYRKPEVYPPNSLQTARVGMVAAREGWCGEFSRAVFHGHFAGGRMVGDGEALKATLAELGREPEATLAAAQAPEIKEALRAQTEQARGLGIFGAPSFVAKGELFWGDDRLEDALDWYRTH